MKTFNFFAFMDFIEALKKVLPKGLEVDIRSYVESGYIVIKSVEKGSLPLTVYAIVKDPIKSGLEFSQLVTLSQEKRNTLNIVIGVKPELVPTVANSFWINVKTILNEEFLILLNEEIVGQNAGMILRENQNNWLNHKIKNSRFYKTYLSPEPSG